MSGKSETIALEVAYATPARQVIVSTHVPRGATVEHAIRLSGILDTFPEIDLAVNAVGIFGERVRLDDVVNSGDRVEIYRALLADARKMRRRRATRKCKPKRQ
ncbi:MAG: RnfH family protein [Acidiferrobacterales bacterium]